MFSARFFKIEGSPQVLPDAKILRLRQKLGQVCLNGSILSLPVCQPGLHAFDLALLMVNGVRFVRERHTVIAVLTPRLREVLKRSNTSSNQVLAQSVLTAR